MPIERPEDSEDSYEDFESFEKWQDNAVFPLAKPQHHGYKFENMFANDDIFDLTDQMVTAYLFDDGNHFAGVTVEDVFDGSTQNFMPENLQRVSVVHVDEVFRKSYDHTRLIGFRTAKRCNSSRYIS